MRMTRIEKFLDRSAVRVYFQRKFEAPRVLSNLDSGKERICIEIGCGQGAGALLINQYIGCDRIICVDIDPEMIEVAKTYISRPPRWARNIRTDNIEFVCQDAAKLSFPDGYFDAAFLFGVLHHIKEWQKVIAEVFRVLKVGGAFSFEETLLPDSFFYFNRLYGHVPIGAAELEDTLRGSGFSIHSFEMAKPIPRCFVRAVKDSHSPEVELDRW